MTNRDLTFNNIKGDKAIQATDVDAIEAKAWCVHQKYYSDPYIGQFQSTFSLKPKQPEICLGYFIRTKLFETSVEHFVRHYNGQCSVISFGAGSDTLFFRLRDKNALPRTFIEIDLPQNARKKLSCIRSLFVEKSVSDSSLSRQIPQKLPTAPFNLSASGSSPPELIFSGNADTASYNLFAADLRQNSGPLIDLLRNQIRLAFIKSTSSSISSIIAEKLVVGDCRETDEDEISRAPILFIFECVLSYISPTHSAALLKSLAQFYSVPRSPAATPALFLLNYEPFNFNDRFGAVMLENLRLRNCPLVGADASRSETAQQSRFSEAGWQQLQPIRVWTMLEAYNALPPPVKRRVERLGQLDEPDLLHQLLQHYCFVIAALPSLPATHHSSSTPATTTDKSDWLAEMESPQIILHRILETLLLEPLNNVPTTG